MKPYFRITLFVCFLCTAFQSFAQKEPQKELARQQRILLHAPIVFLARPIEGEIYTDKKGREHNTTLLQVIEVLRGQKFLHPGLVELVDSVAPNVSLTRMEGITTLINHNDWGVYFCSPATWPHNKDGYKTDNQQRLQLFRGLREASIVQTQTVHGPTIGGFNRGFVSEDEVKAFLANIPNLAPIARPVESYRPIEFIDTRPIKGVNTPKPTPKAVPVKPIEKKGRGHSMSLPLEALPDFPRIMHQLRNKQPLSPADKIYVKRYLPSLALEGIRTNTSLHSSQIQVPASRISKNPTSAARLLLGDTTLTLAIRNLQVVEGASCSRAYEGELWLKCNQPGIYMDQLYFEMSTTADLKKVATPFGPQLDFAYTPLAGAPNYTFYHFFDASTNKITVVAYPAFFAPQRVQLATSSLQPFFRFHYSLPDSSTVSPPSIANARASRQANTVNFTPLVTVPSINYTSFFLYANPVDEQTFYPHHFTNQDPDSPSYVEVPRALTIDTVYSDRTNISAGTRAILWIRGSGFGSSRISALDPTIKGEVRFIDADLGTHPFLPGLDDSDYAPSNGTIWSDTLIKIVIPSFTTRPRDGAIIGAGPIRIKASCGKEVQSRDTVKIRYNLNQATIYQKKEPVYLASIDCSKGRTFFLDSAVTALYPNARAIIKAALRTWSDSLGVPINLSNKLVTGFTSQVRDTINVISFASSLAGTNILMATVRNSVSISIVGSSPPSARAAQKGADIGIQANSNWAFDSISTTTISGYDFYAAILHEVGHCLGLEHSSSASDIMYYTTQGARYTLASGRHDGLAGARLEVRRGKSVINWGLPTIVTFGNVVPRCRTQNRQSQITTTSLAVNQISTPTIYPNPFSGESYLLLPATMLGQVDCAILDATGRIIGRSWVNNTAPIKLGDGLPTGLYFVHLTTATKTFTVRMVKSE